MTRPGNNILLTFDRLHLWQDLHYFYLLLQCLCLLGLELFQLLAWCHLWASRALFLILVKVIDQRLQLDLRVLRFCSMCCCLGKDLARRGRLFTRVVSYSSSSSVHYFRPIICCLYNDRLGVLSCQVHVQGGYFRLWGNLSHF